LNQWNRQKEIAFVFDSEAYLISSSKVKSNRLSSRIGVPIPLPWPECGYPVSQNQVSAAAKAESTNFVKQ
jgi:pyrrolysine biosynthesis protein PylC